MAIVDALPFKGNALVIGVDGQDGHYLAEGLLAAGVPTFGLGRRVPAPGHAPGQTLGHTAGETTLEGLRYRSVDLTRPERLSDLLDETRPARIYHVAAVHGASGFVYEDKWQAALAVNLASVHICLEYIRTQRPEARLLYASSLKAFGVVPPAVIDETTPRRSDELYAITKNAARDLIDHYRRAHGLGAVSLYLFNHESPRRPANFFMPRVVAALAAAKAGSGERTRLASLDFACDWGSAREFMTLGRALLEEAPTQDFVMATGRTVTGLEFVETFFAEHGLDWRDHLDIGKAPGSEPVHRYRADLAAMQGAIGKTPRLTALDTANWILAENHAPS